MKLGTTIHRARVCISIAATVALTAITGALADLPSASVSLRPTGTNDEGIVEFVLQWDSVSNGLYRIQQRQSFESNSPWMPFDLVAPSSPRSEFRVTPARDATDRGFFRIEVPSPEIFGIEPAVIDTNGGTIMLVGQCLGTNATIRVGGLEFPADAQSGDTWRFAVPAGALSGGVYDVEVWDGTNLLASVNKLFAVTGQPTPVGEASQAAFEPPIEPPASPSLMKAKEKANRTKCSNNLRMLPATGELQLEEEDLWVPGRGLDFSWTRTYRSRTGRNSVMGQNWAHNYDISIVQTNGAVAVFDGTGRYDLYFAGTNGVYARNEIFNVGTFSNGVFTLEFPDTSKWVFTPLTNPVAPGAITRIEDRLGNAITFTYDTSGRLAEVIDTLGRTNRVAYNGTGRIESVTDFSGRTVTYTYWRNGEAGGANGDLRSVTSPPVTGTPHGNDFPQGKTRTYTYAAGFVVPQLNHNLLTITDGKNETSLVVKYANTQDATEVNFDRVDALQRGEHAPIRLTYTRQAPGRDNGWAVVKTIVNDAAGNVTIDWFDSRNRGVIHRDLAARAVPGTEVTDANLPKQKLYGVDPDYWETTYEWNLDSLCTRVTFPRGNSTEFVYQRALDHNSSRSNKSSRRSDGNPRVVRERPCCGDVDGDGSPDAADLVWRMEFDPRFGSPAYACSAGRIHGGPRQTTSMDGSWYPSGSQRRHNKGWDGTVKGNARRLNKKAEEGYQPWDLDTDEGIVSNPLYEQSGTSGVNPLCQGSHFTTQTVDPRGGTDTTAYNAQGQTLALRHHGFLLDGNDAPVTSFEYHPNGQLAAIVQPPDAKGSRRRDEFTYWTGETDHLRTATVDAAGPEIKVTQYEYDARGNVTACIDPRGNTNSFLYNQLDQIVERQTPNTPAGPRIATQYTYDANDNLVQLDVQNRDESGVLNPTNSFITAMFNYDSLNRRTLLVHEAAHVVQQRYVTNRLVFDGADNVIEEHSPEAVNGNQPDAIIHYDFDVRRLLRQRVQAPMTDNASIDRFDYDENGQLARQSLGAGGGGSGVLTLYKRDGFGRCFSTTDAMGNVQTFAYDGSHNLVYSRVDGETNDVPGPVANRLLSETHCSFDSLNRLMARSATFFDVSTGLPLLDGASTTRYSYAPNGACRGITDDNGNATTLAYDGAWRLVTSTDAGMNQVSYTYDANDNLLTTTWNDRADLGGTVQTFVTTSAYDALNRRVLEYDNVGNTNRYGYDSRNNLTRHADPRGNDACREFDDLSRCVRTISYVGPRDAGITINTTHVEYDANSRVVMSTDGNSNSTHFAYDPLGRRVLTTRADGASESLVWSPRTNLRQRTDPNGTVITYTYDLLNRCVRKDITPGPGVAGTTIFEAFEYDGMSRLVLATNDTSMVDFTYDSLDHVVKQKQDCIAMVARFDGVGNRTSVTYPGGRVVSYSYDSLNRITNVASAISDGAPLFGLAAFAYEGPRLARIARANGVNTRVSVSGDVKAPNAPGDFGWRQVSQINHQRAGGNVVIDRRSLAYDRAQNKISRTQLMPFAPGQSSTTNTWNYDALSQLRLAIKTKGTSAQIHEYDLDENGNRRATTIEGVPGAYTMSAELPEPADFQVDQYTSSPFGSFIYDRNGNLVSIPGPIGSTDFVYDYANRLVSVTRNVGPATVPLVSYTYDALGARISKTTYPDAPEMPLTTVYYYDRDDDCDGVIEETGNGTLRRTIVYPHVLEVSGRISFAADGHTQYTICDDVGNALALTDEQGEVIERYDYDDFGKPHFLTPDGAPMTDSTGAAVTASPAGNRYLFRGMEWDNETRLYLAGPVKWMAPESISSRRWNNDPYVETVMRCYEPNLGRFISGKNIMDPRSHKHGTAAMFAGNNPWTGGSGENVMFNPREYTLKKEEGGRHTPFHNKYRSAYYAGRTSGHNTPIVRGSALGGLNTDAKPATGNGMYDVLSVPGTVSREAGSGLATGRRSFVMPHVLETSGKIVNARDTGSGMATGRRMREAGSGMATGRRSGSIIILDNDGETEVARYTYFEAWPCRWKAPELNSNSDTRSVSYHRGHVTVLK